MKQSSYVVSLVALAVSFVLGIVGYEQKNNLVCYLLSIGCLTLSYAAMYLAGFLQGWHFGHEMERSVYRK